MTRNRNRRIVGIEKRPGSSRPSIHTNLERLKDENKIIISNLVKYVYRRINSKFLLVSD